MDVIGCKVDRAYTIGDMITILLECPEDYTVAFDFITEGEWYGDIGITASEFSTDLESWVSSSKHNADIVISFNGCVVTGHEIFNDEKQIVFFSPTYLNKVLNFQIEPKPSTIARKNKRHKVGKIVKVLDDR